MSEDKSALNNNENDPKAKFLAALEKKKKSSGMQKGGTHGSSKIHGDQAGGGAPKMFRRKSGSA